MADCARCGTPAPEGALECVACGVVFGKLRAREERRPVRAPAAATEGEDGSWRSVLARAIVEVPDKVDPAHFYGRAFVFGAFAIWTLTFLPYRPADPNLHSFLHSLNLIFHEAGHPIFGIVGWDCLMSLGGSLMQLLIPAVCTGTLLLKTRDAFGASIGLWWLGENFIDLAPYIADARALELELIGGGTGAEIEGHDWEAILTALDLLEYDVMLGRLSHLLGLALMLSAMAWGAYILSRQWPRLDKSPGGT